MMKNLKLKFSEYMQNISRSKSFGKFIHIVRLGNFILIWQKLIWQRIISTYLQMQKIFLDWALQSDRKT